MDKAVDALEYLESGLILSSQRNNSKAKLEFKRAARLEPSNRDTYFSYGNILYKEHKFKEAGLEFCRATRIDPEFVEAFTHWGNSAFLQGHHVQAIQLYKKVLELSPDDDLALNNWGFGLFSLKNYSEAIMKYIEAIYRDSRQNLAYFNLSLLLFHQGNPNEAIKVFEKGMLATGQRGFYRFDDLVDIYSLQVTHTEEELAIETCPKQIEYLQRKLAAIKQILDLLNKKPSERPKAEIPKQGEEELQFGISDIVGDPTPSIYYISLYQQLELVFSQVFFVNEYGHVDQNNNLLATVVPTFKKSLALLSGEKYIEMDDVFNQQFSRNFENMEQLHHFIQIVALKAILARKQCLLKFHDHPLNKHIGTVFKCIKEVLNVKGGLFKPEEFAFIDSLVIFLICLTKLDLQHQGSDKMINKVAMDTAEAFKSCLEWMRKE